MTVLDGRDSFGRLRISEASGQRAQEIYRKDDLSAIAALALQITRGPGSAAQCYGIIFFIELCRIDVLSDIAAKMKHDPLLHHQRDAAFHDLLLQLHVRDAIHEQAAGPIIALIDMHLMSHAVQCPRCGQSAWAATDHSRLLAAAHRGRWLHPAFFEGLFDDRQLILPDCDRIAVHAADACLFAKRRADAAGKFRKRIGRQQPRKRIFVIAMIQLIVPFRDEVVQRAAAHHAAQHHG